MTDTTKAVADKKKQAAPEKLSLDAYRAIVNRCARERLNYPIANGSPFHARILISKLFEVATSRVAIITGALRVVDRHGTEIYGYKDVIETAKAFLRKPDTELSIIVQGGTIDGGSQNVFLRALADDPQRLGRVETIVPNSDALGIGVPHLMVVDASAYRMETAEAAANEHEEIEAIANFGDRELSGRLQVYFDELAAYLRSDAHAVIQNMGVPETA